MDIFALIMAFSYALNTWFILKDFFDFIGCQVVFPCQLLNNVLTPDLASNFEHKLENPFNKIKPQLRRPVRSQSSVGRSLKACAFCKRFPTKRPVSSTRK
jgi:hypothetical protein